MEIASNFSGSLSSPSFLVPLILTALCCCFAVFSIRLKSKSVDSDISGKSLLYRTCNCFCFCGGGSATVLGAGESSDSAVAKAEAYLNGGTEIGGGDMLDRAVLAERQTGASMMEQLVPEITTHALSYLDYPSLCRLSMTNSLMRKAANDDNVWKALYHKDFTLEQDNVTPVNGWKAYYATTKAILNVNTEFFNIIRDRSLQAMGRLWLNADYVKCVHASGEFFSGYNVVMQSWQLAFSWEQGVDFQVRDVRTRVLTDMAWVTMKTFVDDEAVGPFNVTNLFEFHNGGWHMVHHHSSLLVDGDGEQPIVLG